MSLILDALRKIELERKAKRQHAHELRTEVLSYRGMPPAAEKSRAVPITAAVLLASAAIACFFYVKRAEPPPIEPLVQRETLRQEPAPITAVQPLQLPQSESPDRHSLQKEATGSARPARPARPSADNGTVTQNNSAEGITVSGIAWQDERSLRRAVINGFLVGEGAEIQGAKIVEIKESRVRFSRGSDFFEVVHSSAAGK